MKAKSFTRTAYLLLTLVLLAAWQPAASVQAKPVAQSTTALTTYSNRTLGFSIGYPAGWEATETEDSVVFTSPSALSLAAVGKVSGMGEQSLTPSLLNLVVGLVLATELEEAQVLVSSTEVLNGVEWGYLEVACTIEQVPFTLAIFTSTQDDALYLIIGGAHSELFDLRRETFRAMAESFRLLSGIPQVTAVPTPTRMPTRPRSSTPTKTPTRIPTPTSLPDCVVKVRTLNVRSGPGLVYPIISGVHVGDKLKVIGEAYNCGWLKVVTPKGVTGWISGKSQYVTLYRSCAFIPVAPIPPTPTPSPTPMPNRRLPNCTLVQDAGWRDGRGELTIINRRSQDAVAVLAMLDNTAVVSFYVSAGNSCTITGVRDGLYTFYFTSGEDWDSGRSEFTRKVVYLRARSTYQFTTRSIPDGVEYTQWTITLGEGPEPVEVVTKERFPRLK